MRNKTGNHPEKKCTEIKSWLRFVLICIGTISVGLGLLGIFLPILPTTPFLLLAAACYTRSSQKFYCWLINNRWLGKYIKNYREKKGMPLKLKIYIISLLWITILASAIFFVDILVIRILLILIAIGVTIHISRIKTLKG
jgi:uncharacterized membrane protein YbaN (DUF454 family)